jgi:hypothetical protein
VKRLVKAIMESGGDIAAQGDGGDDFTLLHEFALHRDLPVVELFVNSGTNVLAQSPSGVTALTCALGRYADNPRTYEGICRVLIKTINVADDDFDHSLPSMDSLTGGTSLHLAVDHNPWCGC